jgi:hypothetical protein
MFGEGKDVMRIRPTRWIAIVAAIFTLLATLAIGADAFASHGATRCSRPPIAGTSTGVHQVAVHSSWRTGAFKAVGCGAWRRMHHNRHVLSRTGLRS